ncbi:hypothetical protein PPL_00898 [Heterostelium album PN500]|uniref:Uncharacterized protein n=1 Tax=Heterostelium pallidum (strain ATCC 26659 / Pp 5 / PN500) TaxID=670386 RepID=D3AYX9_HETP5|nr:hypothetical protein PPL_00898 [Heterostelium album PN500]EFA85669.1 hypothetical protein PPL_00898 [Heterostelium album PN500]|eukprot:XP_020437776.1 hypothetical protein PPL_00898 [Heterostelium album PN500]
MTDGKKIKIWVTCIDLLLSLCLLWVTDTFGVDCRSWISVPTPRRCPNCNSVLHGGTVVSNPNEPDYSVVQYHRGNTNRNPYGGNPFGGNSNGGIGFGGNPYGGGGGFIDIILVYEWRQVVTFQN